MHLDPMHAAPANSICVILTGALGDFVLALPALMRLRNRWPAASIHLVGNPAWLPLAAESIAVDRTFSVESLPFHEGFIPSFSPQHGLHRFLAGYDRVLSWFGDREGRWENNLRRTLPGHVVVAPFHRREAFPAHVSDFYLQTLIAYGIDGVDPGFDPPWPPSLCWGVAPHGQEPAGPPHLPGYTGLCIHPGSGSRIKNWPAEGFRDVARAVVETWNTPVRVLLGPAEIEQQPFWQGAAGAGLTVHTDLSLVDVSRLLSRNALYLGNDSGVTHLAASLGVPTLAIYRTTDPARWGPRGPRVRVLQDPRPEAPGPSDGHPARPSGTAPRLQPHTVLESLKALGTLHGDQG